MEVEKRITRFKRVSMNIALVGWDVLGLIGLLAIGVFHLIKLIKYLWLSF